MKRWAWTLTGVLMLAMAGPSLLSTSAASADPPTAVVSSSDCLANDIPANDDGGSAEVHLPFGINFYGQSFERLWVNNNGNVTFDGPLPTYTPFGLVDTGAQIIAPFFADVDTRAGQTVTYRWGETTFQGHRAFCVDWVNVGYYDRHTDKTNAFQLLLVQREDTGVAGDFDIVFNYDQIQWETGDASGGVNGLGGESAHAGFSNGSGEEGTSYELAGSGVNGALLDSNQTTGLTNYSTTSTLGGTAEIIPGRHVFPVRSGGAPLTRYVALGDSYQSGEGAGDYLDGTDTDSNKCHRSVHAYPERLVADGVVNLTLDFGACSGARTYQLDDVFADSTPPYDDGISQYDRLDTSTKLVTIGIGGNDLDFAGILQSCILSVVKFTSATCQHELASRLEDNWDRLVNEDRLGTVYRTIRARAPYARIAVLGYPRFYVEGGRGNRATNDYCSGVRLIDQIWVNQEIRRFDDYIRDQARALGLQFIDIYDTPDGHELCSDGPDYFTNGIMLKLFGAKPESYHPNAFGHELIAKEVARSLLALPPGGLFNVRLGQTLNYQFPVTGDSFDASTQWPGSDVVLTLTSPSGRVIDRSTDAGDVTHEVGPTFESYHVTAAEHGTWTATLYGARVAPGGEETRLDIYQPPRPNLAPVARLSQTFTGRTVKLDASASHDPDGRIVRYMWEFGDGATAEGPTASHTYTEPGTYLVGLAVQDDRGRWDVTAASTIVEVSPYDFQGFYAPVDNEPMVNTATAGSAIPVVFSLGGNFGLDVLAAGSPASVGASCATGTVTDEIESTETAGASGLQYDETSSRYKYVWKTDSAWANSCRQFRLKLDDGTVRTALFRFR